jgi:hypothetical protein
MPENKTFSWAKLTLFHQAAVSYIKALNGVETKFSYALQRVLMQVASVEAKVQDDLAAIDVECCVTVKQGEHDGVIVRDGQGGLTFTVQGIKERNRRRSELVAKEQYEIAPHFAQVLPVGLSVYQVQSFSGLVFDSAREQELLDALEARATDDTQPAVEGEGHINGEDHATV